LDESCSFRYRNDLYSSNGNDPWIYGVPFNPEAIMDNLIDTINEIIATGDNCELPYIQILGRKAKKQYVEELIKRNRKDYA